LTPVLWRGLTLWYAAAFLLGILPLLNPETSPIGLAFVMGGLAIIGVIALRERRLALQPWDLALGLILAANLWWALPFAIFWFVDHL
jgi:hypothetical protein